MNLDEYLVTLADENKFFTPEERQREGIKRFKKKVLGRFRVTTEKTLDELAGIFVDLGLIPSIKEAREAVPSFVGCTGSYTPGGEYLHIQMVEDTSGQKRYRISSIDPE
jgi:hypothetical protein